MIGRVLVVAGSDSGGGAGIQADIKTIAALGGYAQTAVTAVTAQDTHGVRAVHPVPAEMVAQQMRAALGDVGADAAKTGMLGDAATIAAVCDVLEALAPALPLVVDPVLAATGGQRLLAAGALGVLMARLLPRAALVTPNIPEAEALTGIAISGVTDMRRAADRLRAYGARAVLVKGGHLPGGTVTDLLVDAAGVQTFVAPRIDSRHTHGTGCTLASAIALGLAQGMLLPDAVERARAYVRAAIAAAPGLGSGHGPLGHMLRVDVAPQASGA